MNKGYEFIKENFPEQYDRMMEFGRRNVSLSTVAPTGSLSILADNCTSGIEPLFQPYYKRRKKINPSDKGVNIDFVDDSGDSWQEFTVVHPKLKVFMEIKGIEDVEEGFKKSPWYDSTANDIDWKKRVKMQSIIQKYITHSISSTINLPEDVTEEEVSDIYIEAWKSGLKGVTVYREGSRSGVLVSNNDKPKNNFEYKSSPKRPEVLEAKSHTTSVDGNKYSVFVGFMNDKPYEVFAYKGGTKECDGTIIKYGSGDYHFVGEGDGSRHRIITGKMTDEQEAFTRLISGSLRHGRHIKYIVDDLNKTSGSLFSFNSAIARVLKKYIPDGESSSLKCGECGSKNMIFEEGCQRCVDCGHSKCG